ncbi:MAG: hypothetical protein UH850_13160 [Paludibacteraceae bacterium]|nr:hypothetical protein [Paludibacteraceae bacterium]
MTIKALNGGKLLCLMAAVAGVMTLGSCNKDDDDPEPEPEPVPVDTTTPKKVVYADQFSFRLNNSTPDTLNAGDTIKASTLLENGVNSDSISVDVVLRNQTMVDPASVSFTVENKYLGTVNVSGNASIKDSIYSITFPAIEGSYSLSINGKNNKFSVVSTEKTTSANRQLSNKYTVKLDATNKSICGIEFVPKEKITVAHLKGSGKFVNLSDDTYNKYLTSALSYVKADIDDIITENAEELLPLKELKHFAYVAENGNIFVVNVVSGNVDDAATEVALEIVY